ncbi:hypothetical protein H2198_007377 [Neophaeococcomyces mojaviensis]|uniref:Uncharacterized protein n=1 Tax=Neophaeococcomyces mojaviensis TaxID=3383035 RepID=A0ACC3A0L2_9EURO|nr:hypothetical protein H2198_007377 [Knufia sp. JES_112]
MSPIASLEERYDFLVILERDYPEYIACVHETYVKPRIWKKEVVFHPWRDSNVTATPCGPLDQAGCYRATGSAVNGLHYHHPWTPNAPLPPRWFVSEEVRRLVLRGELLGRKYGYGISILKQDFYGHADAESSWSTNITPKITSKGNLVIRRQTMFRTRIFDRSLPYRKPNAEQLRQCICRHVTGVLAMALFRNMVDRLYRYQDIRALDPYNWRFSVNADRCDNYPRGWVSHPKLLKCQFCATDIYCRAKLLARDQSLAMTDDEILPTMEAEYYAVVEFDVYHDLGGLYTPLSLAQKKTVRDIARTVTSEEEALERLREDLKIRWSGRQVEWSLHFPTSVKNVKSSNYTAEGICSSAGIPIDVCFLRSDGLPLNNPAIREAWFSTPGDVSSSGGDWRHGFP